MKNKTLAQANEKTDECGRENLNKNNRQRKYMLLMKRLQIVCLR